LAEISIQLYSLNSVLARASRAYSLGLANSQHEIHLAFIQASEAQNICENLFSNIINSTTGTSLEKTKINVANNVFMAKKHAAVHSLTRNY
jgi:hypothetical protein